jgi:hypothetical protein
MTPPMLRSTEPLEPRLALAGVLSFFDVDGDVVTIRSDRGTDRDLAAAASLTPAGLGVQLSRVNLSTPVFAGARVRITSEDSGAGDRQVHVGEIVANADLTAVEVDGDLGRFDIGDDDATDRSLGRLTVRSLGVFGTATGASGTLSRVRGGIGTLAVAGDVRGAFVTVAGHLRALAVGGDIDGTGDAAGVQAQSIGSATVGGSLLGGSQFSSGTLKVFGSIGTIRIGGGVLGGAGESSGTIMSLGRLRDVTIGGSLVGGTGLSSGRITAGVGGIERLTIGGIFGGSHDRTGQVESLDGIGTVRIATSLVGGSGLDSGSVLAARGIGNLWLGGDIVGGANVFSGSVAAGGRIGRLHVGSIVADLGLFSGSIKAGRLGTVSVRGSIIGSATRQAVISALGPTGRAIESLSVGGSITNALVLAGYDGGTPASGDVQIGSVTVGQNLVATSIVAGVLGVTPGQFGRIGDSILGGSTRARIDSVTVGGSAVGSGNPAESFGVSAGTVGLVRIGGARYRFTPGIISSPAGDNFGIHDL